jgi:hypothetical protein
MDDFERRLSTSALRGDYEEDWGDSSPETMKSSHDAPSGSEFRIAESQHGPRLGPNGDIPGTAQPDSKR